MNRRKWSKYSTVPGGFSRKLFRGCELGQFGAGEKTALGIGGGNYVTGRETLLTGSPEGVKLHNLHTCIRGILTQVLLRQWVRVKFERGKNWSDMHV